MLYTYARRLRLIELIEVLYMYIDCRLILMQWFVWYIKR